MDEEWPSEEIPNADTLFMRAHKSHLATGQLAAGVFKDINGGMSTNWEKYCTAQEALAKAKVPADNGIIRMVVGRVREIPLEVKHTPLSGDLSHTDVIGTKNTEVRLKLLGIYSWAIKWGG